VNLWKSLLKDSSKTSIFKMLQPFASVNFMTKAAKSVGWREKEAFIFSTKRLIASSLSPLLCYFDWGNDFLSCL
jgi:hypothetical protein